MLQTNDTKVNTKTIHIQFISWKLTKYFTHFTPFLNRDKKATVFLLYLSSINNSEAQIAPLW